MRKFMFYSNLTRIPLLYMKTDNVLFITLPRKTLMEGVQAAMTTRNLEPDQ
jgi:hypothetical protein